MSTIEKNVLLQKTDGGGNNEIIYPITKEENIVSSKKQFYIPPEYLDVLGLSIEEMQSDYPEALAFFQEMFNACTDAYKNKTEFPEIYTIDYSFISSGNSYYKGYMKCDYQCTNIYLKIRISNQPNTSEVDMLTNSYVTMVDRSYDMLYIRGTSINNKTIKEITSTYGTSYGVSDAHKYYFLRTDDYTKFNPNNPEYNEYIPTLDYNPATKKYVDDIIKFPLIAKWVYPTIDLKSGGSGYTIDDYFVAEFNNIIFDIEVHEVDANGSITAFRISPVYKQEYQIYKDSPFIDNFYCNPFTITIGEVSGSGANFTCMFESVSAAQFLNKSLYKYRILSIEKSSRCPYTCLIYSNTNMDSNGHMQYNYIECTTIKKDSYIDITPDMAAYINSLDNLYDANTSLFSIDTLGEDTTGKTLKIRVSAEPEYIILSDKLAEIDKSIPDRNNILYKNNIVEYTPTADYNPATKKYIDDKLQDTGWVNLELTTEAQSCLNVRDSDSAIFDIKIRKIGDVVKIVGQVKSIVDIKMGYNCRLVDIPDLFKSNSPYEVKTSSFFIGSDTNSLFEAPCHIFLNWKHEYIQLQVLDNIPTGSTLHIDLTYFL